MTHASISGPMVDPDAAAPVPDLLTRTEASVFLAGYGIRMKPATLARAFSTGKGGPPCRRIRNKPFYPRADLAAWAEAQITPLATSSRDLRRILRQRRGRDD